MTSKFELVRASAGTGKSTVLIRRIKELIDSGIKPDSILAFTFTNYATDELKTRMKEYSEKITIGTMHAVFRNILIDCLKYNAEKNKLVFEQPELMSDFDIERTLSQLIVRYHSLKKKNIKDIILDITNLINSIHIPSRRLDDLNKLMCDFEEYKSRNNLITFDDMLYKTYFLLKNNKELSSKWSKRWEYIFVDEFQDSNLLQVELLRILSSHSKHLFAIGDYKQAIYGFRGGNPELMVNFNDYFHNAKFDVLSKTYRNSKAVLNIANQVTESFFSDKGETIIETNSEEEGSFTTKEFKTRSQESHYIVSQLEEETDTMVLTRNNSQLLDIELELLKQNKRYKILGDTYFHTNKHVINLLNVALIINRPEKSATKCYLSTLKWFAPYMKKSAKLAIQREYVNFNNLKKINVPEFSDTKHLINLYDKIDYCLRLKNSSAGDLLYTAYSIMNYEKYIKSSEQSMQAIESINFVEKFIDLCKSFKTLTELFDFVNNAKKVEHESKIRLSTIHKSKGLEADNVIIAGITKGVFPHLSKEKQDEIDEEVYFLKNVFDNPEDDEPHEEEERRLLYVAVTRARYNLLATTHCPSMFFKFLQKNA